MTEIVWRLMQAKYVRKHIPPESSYNLHFFISIKSEPCICKGISSRYQFTIRYLDIENLVTKAHELLPVSFLSLQNESLERNLKMSNYESKSFLITSKIMMVRFNKFSAKDLIANGFYFPDKRIYRLLRNFICVSFVKEHDGVFNLGCFCN